MNRPPVVDCHSLAGAGKTWYDPAQDAVHDLKALFDRGAEAGIDRHCIMAARNETYETANREIAQLAGQHRDRLIGFAVHNPQQERGRIREMLLAEVKSLGLRAVRSDGHPTRELVDAAAELRIPVIFYPRVSSGQSIARQFHSMLAAYPSVDFILPHLGQFRTAAWWGHLEAMDLVKRYPNVYVDTSGIGSLKYLEMAAREMPPERILFGTSAPELDPRVAVESVRLCRLTPAAQAMVMGGNILRLLEKRRS